MAIEVMGRINDSGKLELELPEALPPGTVVHVTIEPSDPDQAWFWTSDWQARERAVDQEIAAGQYTDFSSMEEFLDDLDNDSDINQ